MATYTSTGRAKHVTTAMTANVADTVTLAAAYPYIEIINSDTTNGMYVALARGAADATFPTAVVADDATAYVGPGATRMMVDDAAYTTGGALSPVSKISLVSAGAVTSYHVTGHMKLPI